MHDTLSMNDTKTYLNCEICKVKYNRKGIVTIISDDGNYDSGLIYNNLCKKYDLHMTIAGVVNNIKQYIDAWQTIENEKYLEIINHSLSHLDIRDCLSNEIIRDEYDLSYNFFSRYFKTKNYTFIFPYNIALPYSYEIMYKLKICAIRRGNRGYNVLNPIFGTKPGQWLNLYMFAIGDVETTFERNIWILDIIRENLWLIENWHDISLHGDKGRYQEISIKDAEEHFAFLKKCEDNNDIWIAPFTQAVAYIYERLHSQVISYIIDKSIYIELKRIIDFERCDEMNEAVTIQIELPDDWLNCRMRAMQNDNEIHFNYNSKNNTIYLEMVPNSEIVILEKCEL